MKTAFLFPGQGAQVVGMGRDVADAYPAADAVFERANEIVGYDLKGLCFDGPADKLNTTTVSQPAIFAVSAAILEVLKTEKDTAGIKAEITAGLSLGEYTALYAAGVISFEEALKLVQKRGSAMQAAADNTDGGMVSIIGIDEQKADRLCKEAAGGEILRAVNYNCPGQIVISGSAGACDRAEGLAEKYGAIKAIRLDVAGAFHTKLMSTAAEQLGTALESADIAEPTDIRTIANFDAEYYSSGDGIRAGLLRQLTSAVLWQRCMERLISDGVERFYELGPARVLTGLMRRINRKIKVINVSGLQSLKDLSS